MCFRHIDHAGIMFFRSHLFLSLCWLSPLRSQHFSCICFPTDSAIQPFEIMSGPIDTTKADGGLRQILESTRVSQPVITWVCGSDGGHIGIDTLTDFISWFSSVAKYEEEIKALVDATEDTINGLKELREKGQATSRLRQAWVEGRKVLSDHASASSSPTVAGMTDAQLEAPLSRDEQNALDDAWDKRHHLEAPAWLQGCDALHNRTYREWRAKLPQVPTADKIRSIIAALQPKERREAPVGADESAPWMVWDVQKKLRIETVVDYY